MRRMEKKKIYFYTMLSSTTCILAFMLFKSGSPFNRLINGLFLGGIAALIPGLISYIRSVGPLDILFFGFKNLRAYSKNFEDELEDDSRPKTYHDYKKQKPKLYVQPEPLIIGAIYLIASVIMSLSII